MNKPGPHAPCRLLTAAPLWIYITLAGLLPGNSLYGNDERYLKSYLSVADGLSQNEVTSFCEDRYGFMWIGTRGGLNRYDGYSFRHYKPERSSEVSLQNPSVERLYMDGQGRIWTGTKTGGLSIYDPLTERFRHGSGFLDHMPDRVVSFLEDMEGNQWIGSFFNGLVRYAPDEDSTEHLLIETRISSIIQTPDSTLWFGSNDGLVCRERNGEFRHLYFGDEHHEITEMTVDPDAPYLWIVGWGMDLVRFNYLDSSFTRYRLKDKEGATNTYSLLVDRDQGVWVGTWGGGLYRFNRSDEQFERIDINPRSAHEQISDYDIVLDIYQESGGTIWIGTDGGGVVKLIPSGNFNTITNFPGDIKPHVTSVYESPLGCLLVGTRGQGLYLSTNRTDFRMIGMDQPDLHDEMQSVYHIGADSQGSIWLGMDRGIYLLTGPRSERPRMTWAADQLHSSDLGEPLKVLDILHHEQTMWVATQQHGLYLFEKLQTGYRLQRHFIAAVTGDGMESNRVSDLLLDNHDRLWAATYNGLYRYNESDSAFIPISELLQGESGPLCSIILVLYLDPEGHIWFGTPCSLNRLTEEGDGGYTMTEYTREEELPDDYIGNILQDEMNYIWVSTNSGISRLDPMSGEVRSFDGTDGTGDYSFTEAASYSGGSGELYFGGFAGVTYFNPGNITWNNTIPPVAITNIRVLNEDLHVSEEGILPVNVNDLEMLTLTFREKEVSLEFAVLDFKAPLHNQYAYRLEKHNEPGERVNMGSQRTISLRNLSPGHYTLHLQGASSNGIWNEKGRQLQIEVIPPPWKRWYALVGYILFLMMVILAIIRVSLEQERLKTRAEVEHLRWEQEHQLNETKLRFFTNISHEFRTPLSLIQAPLSELIGKQEKELDPDTRKKVSIAFKNSNRLMKLVNQLLEFRKLEAGKSIVSASEQDVVAFIQEICHPFKELADQKGIRFHVRHELDATLVYMDIRKMSVVMNNLLSNAFKYCGDPGRISVRVYEDPGGEVGISVSNNGKGIAPGDLENIFDRFYQVSSGRYHDSSGIGLALVKNYVEMHQGTVEVESVRDEKTSFRILLKRGKDHLLPEEITDHSELEVIQESLLPDGGDEGHKGRIRHMGTRGARIVVVEDNRELLEYLENMLSEYYIVATASNGKEGFDSCLETEPDLIISDVMMPEMDGFELCQRVKSHEKLAHVPVILLTARGSEDDRLFGIRRGADDYISKPFSAALLMEKIRQVLSGRMLLAEKYSRKVTLEPTHMEITGEDEKLINSAMEIIESHMASPVLNMEFLAGELAMSPTTLYRKMKSLLDVAPGEFIRSVRFKRAAQLLKDTDLTVSEIVERVGYLDVKRFREGFKAEFGLSPTDYRQQMKDSAP
ncbi:MAG: two-component regulator propeller domain-containing protein [Bacteroidota bacterium]